MAKAGEPAQHGDAEQANRPSLRHRRVLAPASTLAVFIGITAYETQMLKEIAHSVGDDPVMAPRYAIVGSLVLYISFINIFLSILRILGRGEE